MLLEQGSVLLRHKEPVFGVFNLHVPLGPQEPVAGVGQVYHIALRRLAGGQVAQLGGQQP